MGDPASTAPMTPAEFLAWERLQTEKHEYHRGEVFAMAGGSARHNFLSVSIASSLLASTRACGCRPLSSDQRIATSDERYLYADVAVVCGDFEVQPGTTDVLANPSIVVEVLSPTTESYDRGLKWEAYQRIASLSDYLLVSQQRARIEHYQRAEGAWRYRVLTSGDTIVLANGATVSVDAIYEGAFALPAAS
jgi:Uma2 family endonuclease